MFHFSKKIVCCFSFLLGTVFLFSHENISGTWKIERKIDSFGFNLLRHEKFIGSNIIITENTVHIEENRTTFYFTFYNIPPIEPLSSLEEQNIENRVANYTNAVNHQEAKYALYVKALMKKITFYNDFLNEEYSPDLFFVNPNLLILYKDGAYFSVIKQHKSFQNRQNSLTPFQNRKEGFVIPSELFKNNQATVWEIARRIIREYYYPDNSAKADLLIGRNNFAYNNAAYNNLVVSIQYDNNLFGNYRYLGDDHIYEENQILIIPSISQFELHIPNDEMNYGIPSELFADNNWTRASIWEIARRIIREIYYPHNSEQAELLINGEDKRLYNNLVVSIRTKNALPAQSEEIIIAEEYIPMQPFSRIQVTIPSVREFLNYIP